MANERHAKPERGELRRLHPSLWTISKERGALTNGRKVQGAQSSPDALDQARVHMQPAPIDQARFHTLLDRLHKQALGDFFAPARPRLRQVAVIGNLVLQSINKEPEIFEPLHDGFHQFPPARHIIEKRAGASSS